MLLSLLLATLLTLGLIGPVVVIAAVMVGLVRRRWQRVVILLSAYGAGGMAGYAGAILTADSHLRVAGPGVRMAEPGIYSLIGAGVTGVAAVAAMTWISVANRS